MSHIHIAAIKAALAKKLTRVCPGCGHKQTLKREQLNEVIACFKCGAQLPSSAEADSAH